MPASLPTLTRSKVGPGKRRENDDDDDDEGEGGGGGGDCDDGGSGDSGDRILCVAQDGIELIVYLMLM